MNKPNAVPLLFVLALAAGCSSAPTKESIARDEARAAAARQTADEKAAQARTVKLEADLKQVPAWVLDPPRPDATGIYAVGMAESESLRVVLKKATLEAEYGLAKLYRQEVSGSERAYAQDRGEGGTTSEQFTALIDKLVAQVPVVGFEVVKQEVKPSNGAYHAYVMLKLPYDEFNKVLQQRKREAGDAGIVALFDDLDRRVRERQAQRLKESEQQHRQKLEETQQRQSLLKDAAVPATVAVPSKPAPAPVAVQPAAK